MTTDCGESGPSRPSHVHGAIALDPVACTACNLCVVECPAWCIELESHGEQQPGPGRTKVVKVLDAFSIDFGLCMYCGICVQVCPFDALAWVPQPIAEGETRVGVVVDMAGLAAMWPRSDAERDGGGGAESSGVAGD